MTDKTQEALKLALKRAFQYGVDHWYQADHDSYRENKKANRTLAEFRQFVEKTCKALAEQPAQQEPVAWRWVNPKGWLTYGEQPHDKFASTPLYTSPPAQPAQQITEAQVEAALKAAHMHSTPESRKDMRRAIEAAHGITKGGAA